jgi:6-pyruvoyltetrahydropterin/6-carboxytetrahydropterin synthase
MLMYEIGIAARFEAAHRLKGDFGPATRLHGHTYRLEVVLRGPQLRPDGTLYDIGQLRPLVDALVGELHYRDLDSVPGLTEVNTTVEQVARFCWERLAPALRGQGLSTLLVRAYENPDAWAALELPLD